LDLRAHRDSHADADTFVESVSVPTAFQVRQPDADRDADTDTDTDPDDLLLRQAHTDADADTDAKADTDTDADTDADARGLTNSPGDPYARSHADRDGDTDTDAGVDRHARAYTSVDPCRVPTRGLVMLRLHHDVHGRPGEQRDDHVRRVFRRDLLAVDNLAWGTLPDTRSIPAEDLRHIPRDEHPDRHLGAHLAGRDLHTDRQVQLPRDQPGRRPKRRDGNPGCNDHPLTSAPVSAVSRQPVAGHRRSRSARSRRLRGAVGLAAVGPTQAGGASAETPL
jgi:hypothetical protein